MSGEWSNYRVLDDSSWTGEGCTVQLGSTVYRVRSEVDSLDLEQEGEVWVEETQGDVPSGFSFPGKCVEMELNGVAGERERERVYCSIRQKKSFPL